MTESIQKRVLDALNEIRPQIQADGGDVELVSVEKQTVKVRLTGHCAGCPMAALWCSCWMDVNFRSKKFLARLAPTFGWWTYCHR